MRDEARATLGESSSESEHPWLGLHFAFYELRDPGGSCPIPDLRFLSVTLTQSQHLTGVRRSKNTGNRMFSLEH